MDGRADKLEGWGEIEAYLRLTRKTILRRGYPVRRVGGEVFARISTLDAHAAELEKHALSFQPAQLQRRFDVAQPYPKASRTALLTASTSHAWTLIPAAAAHNSTAATSSGVSRIILRAESILCRALIFAARSAGDSGLRPAPGRAPPRVGFIWSVMLSPCLLANFKRAIFAIVQ